jgi:prepilin-type N-terminal cleavage/methylation domain-containing protein
MIAGGANFRPARQRAAFSLLELVMVVAILAVAAAIAAPRYTQATARYRSRVAAHRIAADLALASRSARTAGAARTVTFSPAGGVYTIAGLADFRNPAANYRVDLTGEPYCAQLSSARFAGGGPVVVFDGYGTADSDGTVDVQVGDAACTVVFSAVTGKANVP